MVIKNGRNFKFILYLPTLIHLLNLLTYTILFCFVGSKVHIKLDNLGDAEEFIKRTLTMDYKNVKVSESVSESVSD